jgi:hypothetical protein
VWVKSKIGIRGKLFGGSESDQPPNLSIFVATVSPSSELELVCSTETSAGAVLLTTKHKKHQWGI